MSKPSNLQENILLANHTTFRIGGPAKYFCVVKTKDELTDAIGWAKENSLPVFILGGGSNLLVSDRGFEGLVIKVKSEKLEVKSQNARPALLSEAGEKLKVICDAGILFGRVIMETVKLGYGGIEWGFGIPGTVGGAICGNAGRLGEDISQVVESVTVLDKELAVKTLSKEECEFDYRASRFKRTGEIILSATLVFTKKEQIAIDGVLAQAKDVIKKSPPFPSAGCAFKNYKLKSDEDDLLKNHPELASRVRGGKIGVGYLIDQCGLCGRQIGGAKIWEGHANYIVNVGGATAKDVAALINLCKEKVKEKYNLELAEEIRLVGFPHFIQEDEV